MGFDLPGKCELLLKPLWGRRHVATEDQSLAIWPSLPVALVFGEPKIEKHLRPFALSLITVGNGLRCPPTELTAATLLTAQLGLQLTK
jgi:hypothetical protein